MTIGWPSQWITSASAKSVRIPGSAAQSEITWPLTDVEMTGWGCRRSLQQ